MKKSFLTLALISTIFFGGCNQHKNPLINDGTIASLKGRISVELFSGSTEITDCGAYYAGYSTGDKTKLKEVCDKWSKEEFKILQQDPSTPYQANIENFRDPALWNIVTSKKGN